MYCYSVRLLRSKLSSVISWHPVLLCIQRNQSGSPDCFQSLGCNLLTHYLVLLCVLFSFRRHFIHETATCQKLSVTCCKVRFKASEKDDLNLIFRLLFLSTVCMWETFLGFIYICNPSIFHLYWFSKTWTKLKVSKETTVYYLNVSSSSSFHLTFPSSCPQPLLLDHVKEKPILVCAFASFQDLFW